MGDRVDKRSIKGDVGRTVQSFQICALRGSEVVVLGQLPGAALWQGHRCHYSLHQNVFLDGGQRRRNKLRKTHSLDSLEPAL